MWNYISNIFGRLFKRKIKINDPLCKKVIDRYTRRDLSHPDSLTHLITALNNDNYLVNIIERNKSCILIPAGKFGGVNLNYSPEDRLHFLCWDYFSSQRTVFPIRNGDDIRKIYPYRAEDLRMVVLSYVLDADRKITQEGGLN